jgi:hypothetical protein
VKVHELHFAVFGEFKAACYRAVGSTFGGMTMAFSMGTSVIFYFL